MESQTLNLESDIWERPKIPRKESVNHTQIIIQFAQVQTEGAAYSTFHDLHVHISP